MANFSKSHVPQFSVEVYQNAYLPEGGREVNAIVTVTSTGGGTTGGIPLTGATASPAHVPGQGPSAAVVIMVDCSGSMDYPPTKMRNARDATAAAIDTLRDGTSFAVVGGTHVAKEVYPGNGRLATADAQTRAQAKEALRRLSAGGGTAIGTWLRLADRLLGAADVDIRHGILLTDGRNEHESPQDLRDALDACSGRFTCDARGVGTDWEVKEVTAIASALLGTVDIVADPAGLAADFTQMMENAMGKEVADVALRLWTPVGVEIKFVKQVAPTVAELTDRRTDAGPRAGDYPTGSWGDESRDYHVCVQVPEAGIGQEMLAARVSLILPDPSGTAAPQTLSQGLVRAVWTDDLVASTSINPQVAHYTGQAELAQVIQQGLEARKSGDFDGATAKLGRAVQLASASGNADTAKLLSKVVDVVDAATGTVRLKAKVAEADEMTLETRSTKTVRVKK
ncbi:MULTISPECIES: VWA domain-containing protein [unclassified Streptomyces]|uniref:vWA domain-containing protein n=1 Tax=unclassified Streptomyces TaxID=2593676 RepID=UPI002E80407C|nr:VWA domain-containing protein [Streptomyces sp. NBC_00562]WTC81880.1 VWA domain-containing protein [Streptomyces sp. NBC_01653]WTD88985.1 VWA domain-containing protein [Streptomyces sp. NBC_01637]WUC19984.1 VWA domain-containing protein [Streptomyces sp. NBC_00562]